MQSYFFTIFFFVYISKKKPFFRGVNSYKPFLDIYFCPKRKNGTTFGKSYFCVLYILFIFILKETYTIPFYTGHFFQLVRSPGSRRAIIPRANGIILAEICRRYREPRNEWCYQISLMFFISSNIYLLCSIICCLNCWVCFINSIIINDSLISAVCFFIIISLNS